MGHIPRTPAGSLRLRSTPFLDAFRIFSPMELAGALAVVTGATQGIGRAIGVALGQAGAKLAICARTDAAVRATLGDWNRAGIDAIGMRCDVSDPACLEARGARVLEGAHARSPQARRAGGGRLSRVGRHVLWEPAAWQPRPGPQAGRRRPRRRGGAYGFRRRDDERARYSAD